MKELHIIQNRKIFFIFSGALVAVSIIAALVFGFGWGIDFVGGTLWQMKFASDVSAEKVGAFLKDNGFPEAVVMRETQSGSLIARFNSVDEAVHGRLIDSLSGALGMFEELRFDSIGPVIGSELRQRAVWAIVLVLVGISLYIAYSFRGVSYPITSWRYGLVTLLTLLHDVAIPIGLLAVLGKTFHVEVDSNSVVAILVVMGFSVHDTIVVFDRIRENLKLQSGAKVHFESLVNKSINETLARSINTSLTLVLVLVSLYLFGPAALKFFIITLLVGVVAGTYSSIFVASPLLVAWYDWKRRNK
ncbi:MAG: protein-export membrane protein SecF [Parcubacteria group bacterium RIFCSPHIGHO2_02_FULL_48_10b]|nr:MAG: protein-export membrane protein SecF [Parcubacteria group bacterium RIFCSPHIGHO2_02_FULL_48_10b]